ncbi:DUF885 domain-containing protein [Sphingomonas alba]|uniref:DUF885 domain-containing protein n=1 Tax=Sphingomonas alba TaxID=2908208 RepID=A0ABT0RLQ0_9SPHN|nr:DUF885 domain-containing protein [Sphingomonas alba]MCL6683488.1 DUF885 domain-containing protein [Sphingomonas alba]
MRHLKIALAATCLSIAAPALAGPTEDFHKLMDDYWAANLKDSPILATQTGVTTYDRELGVFTLAEMDRQTAEAAADLKRLEAIPEASLSPADQTNYAILRRTLSDAIAGNRFGERQMLFSTLGSLHQFWAGLGEMQPVRTYADYDNYLARIGQVPAQMANMADISRKAAKEGFVQPCVTLTTFEPTITGVIAADPTKSRFYAPFAAPKPASVTDAQWADLQARAKALITDKLNPSYQNWADVYHKELAGKCRQSVGISALPQGKEYYAFLVRQQTTTNRTPDEIHQLGLGEVARIRAEMDALAKKSGFASREAMIADMRTNPKYFAKTPEELMGAAALMAKTIDGKMPTLFTKLPRLPYGVKPIPLETAEGNTTAYYMDGSPDAGVAGTYFVNTTHLDQRPLWELPALTVHEAVPGHHMQVATQQELDMPAWRKYGAFFTAFVEGWGLYSERLGIELGIYDTPQKDMGRLSYEMWRACRLVVDTGIHSKGWTKEQAVAFMKDNTALTDKNIDSEVNRYISNPGQALAYKLGELKIRELRTRAEKELGPKFDLRRFHDAVIGQGAVPLDALDAQINAWIQAEKSRA